MSFLLARLVSNLGYIILIAFVVSRLSSFKKIMQKDKYEIKDLNQKGFSLMGEKLFFRIIFI